VCLASALAAFAQTPDGPLGLPADNYNLAAEWGPSRTDIRHRVFGMMNAEWKHGVTGGLSVRYQSATPYTITTGFDNNGDTVSSAGDKRAVIEAYAQAFNLFNAVNSVGYSGVETSPFFGQPTSALAARRIELGMRLGF
jgi:hypothetical protein